MDWVPVLLLGAALFAGAFVQSSIGFGMAVVAAPFVVVAAPDLMPGSLLVTSFALPVVQLLHGARDIAWRPLGWALGARALLTPLGVLLVAELSVRAISVVVGVLILVTVVASVSRLDVRATPPKAAMAGAVAGVSGTAASIGGPFFALVLQHERPERLRSTLSAFFLIGTGMAIGGLALAGEFSRHQLLSGLVWLPFLGLGYAAAAPARARLDRDRLRRIVLVFCVVAGVSVIVRALVS
ncbi:sulfite exporter TauE/SafE family protein [Phycicoccus ginsengisoli]